MFALHGRRIQGHNKALQVQVVEWALSPEAIFPLVDDKLMIRDRQDKILGLNDRTPKYSKNSRFSSKVQAVGQEMDEDLAQVAVTKREPAKKSSNPEQKQVAQGPSPSPPQPAVPAATQPLPATPQPPQLSHQRPACYNCGVPGHFMRECPQIYSASPFDKGNAGKGGDGKGFKGKGFSQKGKGKGKGPNPSAPPQAAASSTTQNASVSPNPPAASQSFL